jgi:asparagine synthase (glutamine-hydrolysing)
VSFQRYWEMDYLPYEEELKQIAEYGSDTEKEEAVVRQVRARLVDAVQQRMIADVRVGVYLSGGLDSCSILGIASSLQSTPVDAFTISFGADQRFDESQQAKEMAQHANANLHVVEATPSALAESFEASVYHCESPVFNLNGTAKYLLSRAVRQQGMKAVLTGEGSDEIFAGYSFFRHDYVRYHLQDVAKAKGIAVREEDRTRLLQRLKDSNLIWEQEGGSRWVKDEAEAMRRESKRLLRFTPAMLSSIPFIHSASFFSPALRDRYAQLHPLFYHLSSCPSFSPQLLQRVRQRELGQLNGSLYLESRTMLPNILLCWLGDREEMAHSVEGRTPFLDHRLVELVNRLPLDLKLRLTAGSNDNPLCLSEKFVLKRAAAPYLPDPVVSREKHPFLAPPSLLSSRSLMYHYIRDTVHGKEMEELRGVVDVDRLRAVLAAVDREIAEGRQAVLDVQEMLRLEQWLLGMCSLSILRKQFKVQKE